MLGVNSSSYKRFTFCKNAFAFSSILNESTHRFDHCRVLSCPVHQNNLEKILCQSRLSCKDEEQSGIERVDEFAREIDGFGLDLSEGVGVDI